MKTEERVKKELIEILKQQVERLKKSDDTSLFQYKLARVKISTLEDMLELNCFN